MDEDRPAVISYQPNVRVPWLTHDQAWWWFRVCRWVLVVWTAPILLASFFGRSTTAMLISVFGAPVAVLALGAAALAWGRWMDGRRRWGQIIFIALCPLLVVGAIRTNWPLRLAFVLSSPALNRLADQVAAGRTPALPVRAGAVSVRWVEVQKGSWGSHICLWTAAPGGGHVGFVRSPVGSRPQGNRWTELQMSAQWRYFGED